MATSSVQWQCTKTLPECLLRMLDEEIACDVTFLIGERAQEVKAHKIILMSRSPVFYSMLEGPLAEKGKMTITDVDKESFNEFLRYLYTDTFKPNSNTVMGVLYCAKKYCVDNLSKVCSEFLRKNITTENVCIILGAAHRFDDKDIIDSCISVVQDSTGQFLKRSGFLEMSKECLGTVLDLDKVDCSEEEIYEGVMRWAGEECRRQEMEVTPVNSRTVLADLIYKIRFATMDPIYFSRHISNSCILSNEEKVDIFRYMLDILLETYVIPSGTSPDGITAFPTVYPTYTCRNHKTQYVYPLITYAISIKARDGNILYTGTESLSTDAISTTYSILLSRWIHLKKGERYTIEINQKPNPNRQMYYGWDGQKSVTYGAFRRVTFFPVRDSVHTDVLTGQFPGLMFSD